jgi:hypothetical protein
MPQMKFEHTIPVFERAKRVHATERPRLDRRDILLVGENVRGVRYHKSHDDKSSFLYFEDILLKTGFILHETLQPLHLRTANEVIVPIKCNM